MDAIMLWLDKVPADLLLKLCAIAITAAILGDFVLRAVLFAIKIRRAVKPDGDVFIIK